MAATLTPFMRVRELARALREPKARESQLMRQIGWRKTRSVYQLDVRSAAAPSWIPASHVLPLGTYRTNSISQCLIPLDTSLELAAARGITVRIADPDPEPPPPPPPPRDSGTGVVAVLAHVDHGKTTLLDALLGSEVAQREAGGITQCVRPSLLRLGDRGVGVDARGVREAEEAWERSSAPGFRQEERDVHTLAFVDTPGHKVFTGMRAAAADGADLALILVAIDAGVQPQTREVVRRCALLRQPVLFALTKADTAGASLAEAGVSRRTKALKAQLRRLWASELRRAGGRTARLARSEATRAPIPVLCAPRQWGVRSLLRCLGRRLREIGPVDDDRLPTDPPPAPISSAPICVSSSSAPIPISKSAAPDNEAVVLKLESRRDLTTTLPLLYLCR